jgi:predicted dehydrogenase
LLATQVPEVKIIDGGETRKVVGVAKKDTPDQIILQATLKTGAVLSLHIQGGPPPPFDPKFLWRISGEKGDLDISADYLRLNVISDGITIRLYDRESGNVEEVPIEKDELDDLPGPAKNIGRVYEAFAKGDKKFLVTFEEAFQRHVLIEKILKHWDDGDQGWKV